MNRVEQVTGKGVVREESPKPSKKLSDEFKDLLEKIASKVTLETNRAESAIEVISPIKTSPKAKPLNNTRSDTIPENIVETRFEQKIQVQKNISQEDKRVDEKLPNQSTESKIETKGLEDQNINKKSEVNQTPTSDSSQQPEVPQTEENTSEVALLQDHIEGYEENIEQVQSYVSTSQVIDDQADVASKVGVPHQKLQRNPASEAFQGSNISTESVEISDIQQLLDQKISSEIEEQIPEISAKDLEVYFKLKDLQSTTKSPLEQALESVTPQNIQAVFRQLSSSSEVMKSIIESAQSSQINQKVNKDGAFSPSIIAISSDIKKSGVDREVRQRPLSRAHEARTMEKVESVLKEAVKSKDNKSITLRLDPPSLGAMRIDVGLKDGTLHAKLIPESLQVGNFLREHAHELVISLRKLGLHVEKVTVSVVTEQGFESQDQAGSAPFSREEGQKKNSEESHEMSNEVFSNIQESHELKATNIDHWVA